MQPRGNFCLTAEATETAKGCQESLLSRVPSILLTAKHAVSKRKYPTLPAPHQLAKSFGIARQGAFNDYLVATQSFHSRALALNDLDAPGSSKVNKSTVST